MGIGVCGTRRRGEDIGAQAEGCVHPTYLLLPRCREKVIVATKVAGPSGQMTWIRGGPAKVDAANISAAIDGSLQRLGTDYIDLYQVWTGCESECGNWQASPHSSTVIHSMGVRTAPSAHHITHACVSHKCHTHAASALPCTQIHWPDR